MNLSNPVNLLIAGIYYVLTGGLVFFALFGVYVLLRYGQSRPAALLSAVIFALFFLTILNNSYHTLQLLLQ
jgi:hypothetical protein